jgi:hypothetical protein
VIGAARSAVAGGTELPTVLLIGAVVLDEVLTTRHLLAALLVGAAIVLTPVTRGSHVLPDTDDVDPLAPAWSDPAPALRPRRFRRLTA